MNKRVSFIIIMFAMAAVSLARDKQTDLDRLVEFMTGSFSTAEQALMDPGFYDIRLVVAPIWTERSDGPWIYIEQASASHMNKPYRQRVYRLSQENDTTFRFDVFDIENRERFVGKWIESNFMRGLAPDSLIPRDGCEIILYKKSDTLFEGGTIGNACSTNYRDAHYRTSLVRVTPSTFYSWDRGYSEFDEQIWGATSGGYEFRREGGQ